MQLKVQISDFRLPIADLWVCDAFGKKRPTPMEFYKSAIKNPQLAIFRQPMEAV